jgi:hypothetical protein
MILHVWDAEEHTGLKGSSGHRVVRICKDIELSCFFGNYLRTNGEVHHNALNEIAGLLRPQESTSAPKNELPSGNHLGYKSRIATQNMSSATPCFSF